MASLLFLKIAAILFPLFLVCSEAQPATAESRKHRERGHKGPQVAGGGPDAACPGSRQLPQRSQSQTDEV